LGSAFILGAECIGDAQDFDSEFRVPEFLR